MHEVWAVGTVPVILQLWKVLRILEENRRLENLGLETTLIYARRRQSGLQTRLVNVDQSHRELHVRFSFAAAPELGRLNLFFTAAIPRSAPPPVGSLALPTTALPTTSPAKSSSGGFKLSSFMKRDRAPSNAASSKYGNLDVPSSPVGGNPAGSYSNDNFDRQSFDSRISEQPEEATPTPPASFARTNSNGLAPPARERPTSMFGGKKRDSLMPFGGSLFRKGTVKSPAVEKNQNDGGLSVPGYGGSRGRSDSDARSARSTTDRSFQEQAESTRGGYSNALGASTSTMMSGTGSTVDSEGFSVPPAGYDKQPWETNGNANLMDDDEDEM